MRMLIEYKEQLPNTPENVDRRRGAITASRELLRQGLDVEASCQVQDWPSFLSQRFDSLLANEITDLFLWDSLELIWHLGFPASKKSCGFLNSILMPSACIIVMKINKAENICECLIASKGIDLKFEEVFCLFLLGEGTEAEAVEKLKQLGPNSNPKQNSVLGKAIMDASKSSKMWLKDSVLDLCPDTKGCSPALANFFNVQKKFSRSKNSKGLEKSSRES
ncbi:plastid division protein CDP1 [Sesbania bispinosa]|nr:plastid division protein CDP1 [Sesbania bispinosa]